MSAYGSLCTEFYDLDKPSPPADALAFYVDRARKAGGRVLEPMCGSGRFLLPMSLAGLPVDGVDSSAAMLAACRAHARSLGSEVSVFLQTLASLELPHRYSMAFIPSGSIGLVTDDEELHKVLSRIHAHLEPGGSLLLELVCDDGQPLSPAVLEPRTVLCPDGSSITYTCIASRSTIPDTICYSGTYLRRQGTRTVETEFEELVLRLYDTQRVMAELAACGFEATTVSGASDSAFLAESGCMLVEARADS
jgi:SAM-dependent methyltransferase